jgi:hypothetical protein
MIRKLLFPQVRKAAAGQLGEIQKLSNFCKFWILLSGLFHVARGLVGIKCGLFKKF